MAPRQRKHRRPKVPGDRYLGPAYLPGLRECITCKYKPIPRGLNCPNCGRDEAGFDGRPSEGTPRHPVVVVTPDSESPSTSPFTDGFDDGFGA